MLVTESHGESPPCISSFATSTDQASGRACISREYQLLEGDGRFMPDPTCFMNAAEAVARPLSAQWVNTASYWAG